jgi:hypothetical protein
MSDTRTEDDDFKAKLFELDKDQLDSEWLSQSRLVYAAGVEVAKRRESWERAKTARDVAKDDLKETAARLLIKIRSDFASYGLDKATDSTIDAAILVQDEYKEANRKFYEAEEKVIKKNKAFGLAEIELKALDPNRLKQLENLTQLDNRSYWDRAKVERGPKDAGTKERVLKELGKKTQHRRKSKKK